MTRFAIMVITAGLCATASTQGDARRPPPLKFKPCKTDAISRSKCMIELILADLQYSHGGIEQGGISEIKEGLGKSYTVALPREEATDYITYRFRIVGNTVAIAGKSYAVKSYP